MRVHAAAAAYLLPDLPVALPSRALRLDVRLRLLYDRRVIRHPLQKAPLDQGRNVARRSVGRVYDTTNFARASRKLTYHSMPAHSYHLKLCAEGRGAPLPLSNQFDT